jgi:hypothetical protein
MENDDLATLLSDLEPETSYYSKFKGQHKKIISRYL